jgi:hypothetical protein
LRLIATDCDCVRLLPASLCRYLLTDAHALQWARVFERRLLADEWYLPTVLMHSPFRRTAIDLPLRYEMWPENEAGARARYWASLPEAEWGGAMLLDGKALAAAQRSPLLFAKKVLPSHEPTLLRRHDAWMARKLSGEPEPQQPPIASPHLRADPTLDSFGMPALGGEAAADDGEAPSRAPDPDVPPESEEERQRQQQQQQQRQQRQQQQLAASLDAPLRRRRGRRRRVASLVFTDGSSCSCAPECRPIKAPWAASPEDAAELTGMPFGSGDATGDATGTPLGSGEATSTCCMHAADGRAALCAGGSGDDLGSDLRVSGLDMAALPLALRPCPQPRLGGSGFSSGGGQPVQALFLNRSPYPVRVLHVDSTGAEQALLSLRPAEHAEVDTDSLQAWRVRTLGGSLLVELDTTPRVDDASGMAAIHIEDCLGA